MEHEIKTFDGIEPIDEQEVHYSEAKFSVGQTVKIGLGGTTRGEVTGGVIVRIYKNLQNGSMMYTIKAPDGRRRSLAECFLELDETIIHMEVDGKKQDVVIENPVSKDDMGPQFKEGDIVTSFSFENKMRGVVLSLDKSIDATGNFLYVVKTEDGEIHRISESLLESSTNRRNKSVLKIVRDEKIIDADLADGKSDKQKAIEEKTKRIIEFLHLEPSQDPMVQLENALKIHKYIAQNISYNSQIMKEKESMPISEVYTEELYNGLIRKQGVCTTDAIVFKHLLAQIGMNGDVVILKSKEGGTHAATLVELDRERYYFDTTLERTIFEENSGDPDRFIFCCAGLGSQEYSQFYNMVGVLPEDLKGDMEPIPNNVSKGSVPKAIIHSIGNGMQNLTFKDETLDRELMEISAQVPIEKKDESVSRISKLVNRAKAALKKLTEKGGR